MTHVRTPLDPLTSPIGAVSNTFAERVRYFRRAFASGVGRAPSRMKKLAINKAAILAAEAERVLNDPSETVSAKVAIDRASRRALLDLQALIAADAKPADTGPTLAQYLAATANGAAE